MKLEYPAGATPLDPDEIVGLIPEHITTQAELNEWGQANILEAEMWFSASHRFAYNNVPTAGNVIGGQNLPQISPIFWMLLYFSKYIKECLTKPGDGPVTSAKAIKILA